MDGSASTEVWLDLLGENQLAGVIYIFTLLNEKQINIYIYI